LLDRLEGSVGEAYMVWTACPGPEHALAKHCGRDVDRISRRGRHLFIEPLVGFRDAHHEVKPAEILGREEPTLARADGRNAVLEPPIVSALIGLAKAMRRTRDGCSARIDRSTRSTPSERADVNWAHSSRESCCASSRTRDVPWASGYAPQV